MEKLKFVFILWWNYRPERIIKFVIILLFATLFCAIKCEAQPILNDSIKVSRMDMITFAENSILLRNCEEDNIIYLKVINECNDLQKSLKIDIDTKLILINSQASKILDQQNKIIEQKEIITTETTKRKYWRNGFLFLSGIVFLQTYLLLK